MAITRSGRKGRVVHGATFRDITERKRAEQHRNVRLAVTHALSEAASVDDGASGVLRAVCENLGWDVGFLWTFNQVGTALVCTKSWHRPDVPVDEFETASCSRTFATEEGLPGHVWASGEPVWILDIAQALAALTGWGQQEDRHRTADAGFDHHLVKSPESKVLERLLSDLALRKTDR